MSTKDKVICCISGFLFVVAGNLIVKTSNWIGVFLFSIGIALLVGTISNFVIEAIDEEIEDQRKVDKLRLFIEYQTKNEKEMMSMEKLSIDEFEELEEIELEEIAKILASDCGRCSDCEYLHKEIKGTDACYFRFAKMIRDADYRKKKNAEWILHSSIYDYEVDTYRCSGCGAVIRSDEKSRMRYCPGCGAKMEGGAE